ncbi:MAG: hypothetical protein IJ583_01465 [Firmicutes bacterium]|nr:hypothetical protein [Bacillota bacterium]
MKQEAIDLLYKSIEEEKKNSLSQPIGMYLINACSEENADALCDAVISENKKFEYCLNYIVNYAKKNAVKNESCSCAAFADDVIYGKAVEYYMSDNISEEDIKGLSGTKAAVKAPAEVKVAKSKISSDKQDALFDLDGGDEDDKDKETEESEKEVE